MRDGWGFVHEAARREVVARGRGPALALAWIAAVADLALDVVLAEGLLGMEEVVGAAANAQVPTSPVPPRARGMT